MLNELYKIATGGAFEYQSTVHITAQFTILDRDLHAVYVYKHVPRLSKQHAVVILQHVLA